MLFTEVTGEFHGAVSVGADALIVDKAIISHSDDISSATFSPNSRFVVTTGLVSLDRGTENIAKIIELWKEE
ncbi:MULTISPECIES: hypothetical protein [unclassified Endozoicomonas]|uniref:hypothetical protein n=1 Tax=unclassified Endozoicomonas TaxID=2644528 RepID=UPI002148A08B|nr:MULTISPECIES: hypothetical protein [unclassified Endozoicomonas]